MAGGGRAFVLARRPALHAALEVRPFRRLAPGQAHGCITVGAMEGRFRAGGVLSAALVAAAASALVTGGAGADAAGSSLPTLGSFGAFGGGAGELHVPRGVAVDGSARSSKSDVYVADQDNERIDRFGPTGAFQLAFGVGVNATKVREAGEGKSVSEAEENLCAASSGDTCQKAEAGSGAGQLHGPMSVAVDPVTGEIYVEDFLNHRIDEYSPEGRFLLTFGGKVNAAKVREAEAGKPITAAEEDLCVAGESCRSGTVAATGEAGDGAFHKWAIGPILAAGPGGTIYVGDEDAIEEFDSSGAFTGEIPLPGAGSVSALAVDAHGNVYLKSTADAGVRELEPSAGAVRESSTVFDQGSGTVAGIAVGGGHVYVLDSAGGDRVLQYGPSGALIAESAPGQIEASDGLAVSAAGTAYVSDYQPGGSLAQVRLFGDAPTEGVPVASIESEHPARVGVTTAMLAAKIDPQLQQASYYVQYGTSTAYGAGAVPAPPGASLQARNLEADPAAVSLEGLTPGTLYHYRFVAISAAGTAYGPDRTFTTYRAAAFALPDGRAFELVSPPAKNGAEVAVPSAAGGLANLTVQPLQAAASGDAITYGSFTAFGEALSAPATSQYLSTRTPAGWTTQDISPPDREGYLRDPLRGFSEDLTTAVLAQGSPPLAPAVPAGYETLYLRSDATGRLQPLSASAPRIAEGGRYCVAYAGASAGFAHVMFSASGALTAGAPEGEGNSLYESDQGRLRLLSVLPGGEPAPPSATTGFGAGGSPDCRMGGEIVAGAVSKDGSRVIWTYRPHSGSSELLARVNGVKTVQIDAPQGGSAAGGEGRYWAASRDGARVIFTDIAGSEGGLTPDAPPESGVNLYEYDLQAERLTDLTPVQPGSKAAVLGVLGASEDGSSIYFAAQGALAEGAAAGADNLYLSHEDPATHSTTTTFIAKLNPADAADWSAQPRYQTARVIPDGRDLAFMSTAELTGYDNRDQQTGEPVSEVYLYEAGSGRIVCASCNPSGAAPLGPSSVPSWSTPYEQPRYLSDSGGRLFFTSYDALAPQEQGGSQQVYEWERSGLGSCAASNPYFSAAADGCIFAITPGGEGNSYLLDASSEGEDVFVSTRESLLAQDLNERYDVYDARIGGGFVAPAPAPAPCAGEACRPEPVGASAISAPASETYHGPGNRRQAQASHHHQEAHRRRRHRHGRDRSARACQHRHDPRHGRCRHHRGRAGPAHHNGHRNHGARRRMRAHAASAPRGGASPPPAPATGGAASRVRPPSLTSATARPAQTAAPAAVPISSTSDPVPPPGAGISSFQIAAAGPEGEAIAQAGAHPYRLTFGFALQTTTGAEGHLVPAGGDVKDLRVSLPPGLVGDPLATPRCAPAQFNTPGEGSTVAHPLNSCPAGSAVGYIDAQVEGHIHYVEPVYDLRPPPGMPAQLGFQILSAPFYVDTAVHTATGRIEAFMPDVTEVERIIAATLTLWGVPAQASHDPLRGRCLGGGSEGPVSLGSCPAGVTPEPFLTLPVSCAAPAPAQMSFDTWTVPGAWLAAIAGIPTPTGCSALAFDPTISVQPETGMAGDPTGLQVSLTLPQSEDPSAPGEADLRDAVIRLPAGLVINPSTANGLAACSEQQIGFEGLAPDGRPRFSEAPADCPDASKIGSVTVHTPPLEGPLHGALYVAQQGANPFGALLAVYLVAEGDGVIVKLAGRVQAEPQTGRLTVTFDHTPQLPFASLKVALSGGPRATLTAPAGCGEYQSTATLTPWSAPRSGPPATRASTFTIAKGCSSGFAPSLTAGTTANHAGAFSPFIASISRHGTERSLGRISLRLPRGLIADIASVTPCPQARARSGACPPSSEIGTVSVTAGAGADPVVLPQLGGPANPVYLTGPYAGAPFGLAVVIHAQAGPYDLGTVVVRARVEINPHTAQVSILSEPLPQILQGIPLQVQTVSFTIARGHFVKNPTSCRRMQILSTISSPHGEIAAAPARFQAAACGGIRFHPRITALTHSHHTRRYGEYLHLVLRAGRAQASLKRVHVLLPKQLSVRASTLKGACPAKQFAADPAGCPASAIVGSATVRTPVLPVAMHGPAILVTDGGARFPRLALLLQGDGVTILTQGSSRIGRSGRLSSTFAALPDVPIGRFDLVLPAGAHSLLGASGRLCSHRRGLTLDAAITGQNGADLHRRVPIMLTGCHGGIHRFRQEAVTRGR